MLSVKSKNLIPYLFLLLAGCHPAGTPSELKFQASPIDDKIGNLDSANLDFPTLYSEILEPKCLACHDNVSSEDGIANWIVNQNPDESPLFLTVVDGYMPAGGTPLTSQELDFVSRYIEQFSGGSSSGDSTTTSGGSSSGDSTTTSGGSSSGDSTTTSGGSSSGDSTTTSGGSSSGGSTTTSGGSSSGGTISYITYAQLKTNILTPQKCLNCHSSEAGTESALISNWVDLNSPTNSKLYKRVVDNTMPKGMPDLTSAQKAYILQYIYDYKAQH